jgi:hypothetical protein
MRKGSGSSSPLVPAEAGTHLLPGNKRPPLRLFSLDWIPAYAGMSGYELKTF